MSTCPSCLMVNLANAILLNVVLFNKSEDMGKYTYMKKFAVMFCRKIV